MIFNYLSEMKNDKQIYQSPCIVVNSFTVESTVLTASGTSQSYTEGTPINSSSLDGAY